MLAGQSFTRLSVPETIRAVIIYCGTFTSAGYAVSAAERFLFVECCIAESVPNGAVLGPVPNGAVLGPVPNGAVLGPVPNGAVLGPVSNGAVLVPVPNRAVLVPVPNGALPVPVLL